MTLSITTLSIQHQYAECHGNFQCPWGCHDTQQNDARHSDTQHNNKTNMTLRITITNMTLSINDTKHIVSICRLLCFYCYAECLYAEYCGAFHCPLSTRSCTRRLGSFERKPKKAKEGGQCGFRQSVQTEQIESTFNYSKTMFLVLDQVYYWGFKSNTHNNYN